MPSRKPAPTSSFPAAPKAISAGRFVFVASGELRGEINSRRVTVGKRSIVHVPAGVPHGFAAAGEDSLVVHDEHTAESSLAYALSRLSHTPHGPTPLGVFRDVERPVYDALMAEQIETTKRELGNGELGKLLRAGDTWTIA